MKEPHTRSIAKAFTWRVVATMTTAVIAFAITGEVSTALAIGGIEFFVKLLAYYVHERAWQFGSNDKRTTVDGYNVKTGDTMGKSCDHKNSYILREGHPRALTGMLICRDCGHNSQWNNEHDYGREFHQEWPEGHISHKNIKKV